jgi:2-amino-4-hydroxy-6-hydroxymethyldihydropteridine diphosphokinase
MTARVYIALGSNLGDRQGQLDVALERLAGAIDLDRRSPIYETAPKYVTDQPAFLNMVVSGETPLDAPALMAVTQGIERALGRIKTQRFGPRSIDLDILFYGDAVIDAAGLTVPHPRLTERRFVLQPLADIAPDLRHPVTGKSVAEMLAALPPDDDVRRYEESTQN